MTLLPQHRELIDKLITECQSAPDETQWWIIGAQMHTITDDYKLWYDYPAAKPELDAMWNEWIKVDPRENDAAD